MGKKGPQAIEGAQEHISVLDRYLVMGLAGRLGWKNVTIKNKCAWLGKDAIERWAKRGREGREDAEDDARSGRPAKLTGKQQAQLKRALQNRRFATPSKLAHKFGVCEQTVRNRVRAAGLKPVKVSKRCRQSEEQRAYRVEWGQARKREGLAYWKRWVWSDEKWFFLVCKKSGEWVWVAEDDLGNDCRYVPKDKHPTKVMVWAAISYDGRSSLHLFPSSAKD